MQQWQAVKDAINSLTGVTDWTWDSTQIKYQEPLGINDPDPTYIYWYDSATGNIAFENGTSMANYVFAHKYQGDPGIHMTGAFCDDRGVCFLSVYSDYSQRGDTNNGGFRRLRTEAEAVPPRDFQYLQANTISQKILSNLTSTDQGSSLLAEAYLDNIAQSIFNTDESKQFVKLSDLIPQFEANIYNFSKPLNLKSDYIVDEGLKTTWDSTGYVSTFNYYRSETPIDINNLPNPIIINSSDSYYTETTHSDKAYYIVVGSLKNGIEKLSEIIKVLDGELLPLTDVTFEVINI